MPAERGVAEIVKKSHGRPSRRGAALTFVQ